MVSCIVDVGKADVDATVIQNSGQTVYDHIRQISVYVHWKDEGRREKDAIVS